MRTMFRFIPKSKAIDQRSLSAGVRLADVVAREARSSPSIEGEARSSAAVLRSALLPSAITPRIAPRSRRWRVSRRVSTPVSTGMPADVEPVGERRRGLPVGVLPGELPDHDAAHLRTRRFVSVAVMP